MEFPAQATDLALSPPPSTPPADHSAPPPAILGEVPPLRTICCYCRGLVCDGALLDGLVSHGAHETCLSEAMRGAE
jgi:hypothetical protein